MLQLQHISKSFPGVKALQDVSITFEAGKVHALCGENGAGKSTLMNIISGNLQADAGRIVWKDQEVVIPSVQQAQRMGIGIVYQERSLVDALSVAENIYPVNQPLTRLGFIDHRALHLQAAQLMAQLNLQGIAPGMQVGLLSASQKQLVEIAKALALQPQLLILDEPTASLTSEETATLFGMVRQLKKQGVAVIYISHRMAEIRELADMVSILKDGCLQGTFHVAGITTEDIVRKMVGRDIDAAAYRSNSQEEIVLQVSALSGPGFSSISFHLHKGEILGLAGLQGAGRTALAEALFGALPVHAGSILLHGREVRIESPLQAIAAGVAYLPDDRKAAGLFGERSVAANIEVAARRKGWFNRKENEAVAAAYCERLHIRTPSVQQEVRKLSGGNQQKVVLAKWLHTQPGILLVNEPTHGVDVGAKAEIYNLLKSLTAAGKSILLISSELPELLLLSDRIGVMWQGQLRALLERSGATEERITALASGLDEHTVMGSAPGGP